jgi:hypothetical protein
MTTGQAATPVVEPVIQPKEKKVDEIAIIFDLSHRTTQPTALAVFMGGQSQIPAPGILVIPAPPTLNENGIMVMDQNNDIVLHFGANMGIDRKRWEEVASNPPPSLADEYFGEVGCFTVIKPAKVGVAKGYRHFTESDAKILVSATVGEKFLDDYSDQEARSSIQLEVSNQRKELAAELEQRQRQ